MASIRKYNRKVLEVTIDFAPGEVLEISARGIKKTVTFAEMGVFDRKKKELEVDRLKIKENKLLPF